MLIFDAHFRWREYDPPFWRWRFCFLLFRYTLFYPSQVLVMILFGQSTIGDIAEADSRPCSTTCRVSRNTRVASFFCYFFLCLLHLHLLPFHTPRSCQYVTLYNLHINVLELILKQKEIICGRYRNDILGGMPCGM